MLSLSNFFSLTDLGFDIEHIGVLSKVGRVASLERKTKQCDRNFSFLKEGTHCKCCLLATTMNQIWFRINMLVKGLFINLTSFVHMLNFVIFCLFVLETPKTSKFVPKYAGAAFSCPQVRTSFLSLCRAFLPPSSLFPAKESILGINL